MEVLFDREKFADAKGSKFKLTAADGKSVDIELDVVTELKERANQRSFSVFFTVPQSYFVEQGLYDIQHEVLGDMQLFLVPIITEQPRQELEAVFSFLVRKENTD